MHFPIYCLYYVKGCMYDIINHKAQNTLLRKPVSLNILLSSAIALFIGMIALLVNPIVHADASGNRLAVAEAIKEFFLNYEGTLGTIKSVLLAIGAILGLIWLVIQIYAKVKELHVKREKN